MVLPYQYQSSLGRDALRVPGFFEGQGKWCIRFMPPVVGSWDIVTESDIPALMDHFS